MKRKLIRKPQLGEVAVRAVDAAVSSRWRSALSRAASVEERDVNLRVKQVSKSFARELGMVGAATGAAAAAPGVGTGAALAVTAGELSVTITRTTDLILTIGAVHGLTDASIEERRAWVFSILLFGDGAAQGFTKIAGEVGKGLGSKATAAIPMPTLRAINKTLGRTIITKYGTKRGAIALGRLLPFGIGAVIGGSANLVITRAVGRYAHKFFSNLPDELRRAAPALELGISARKTQDIELDGTDDVDAESQVSSADLLDQLLTPKLLDSDNKFVCSNAHSCSESAAAKNYGFAAGQLSFVGERYDAHEPRVLVISMQVGDAIAPVRMGERADQVSARILESPGQRNPHMRGTVRALQILHGRSVDEEAEYLNDGAHVLDAYAMANSTLCSALPTGGKSRRGKPTSTMLANCASHLALTIETLKPSIVLTQGTDTAAVFRDLASVLQPIDGAVWRAEFGGHEVIWCELSHPAAGPPSSWSSMKPGSYFDTIVRPSLELARSTAIGTSG